MWIDRCVDADGCQWDGVADEEERRVVDAAVALQDQLQVQQLQDQLKYQLQDQLRVVDAVDEHVDTVAA